LSFAGGFLSWAATGAALSARSARMKVVAGVTSTAIRFPSTEYQRMGSFLLVEIPKWRPPLIILDADDRQMQREEFENLWV
jgi:hypothetical protein